MLKKFALFFAIVYSICLLAISLAPLDKFPKIEFNLGDKTFHFFAYMLMCFFWFKAFLHEFKFKNAKALTLASVFSVFFGVIVEVFQHVFTAYRTFDIYDVLSNTLGALIMAVILIKIKKIDFKEYNSLLF